MKVVAGLLLLLGMSVMHGASAQIYKWTDSKGVVHYSDTPLNSQSTPVRSAPPPPPALVLPYELAQAVRKHPVTLYTAAGCAACDQGRALLKGRGVPFAEKTVGSEADEAKLREAGSDGSLPLLLVGRTRLTGFEAGGWHGALDAAGYPRRSLLPKAYRYEVASAADPVVMPAPLAHEAEAAPRTDEQPRRQQRSDLPPGFQF